MLRLPAKLVGIGLGLLLGAHLALFVPAFHAAWFRPDEWTQNALWLALALGVALIGRLLLSFLPPGSPGGHEPRAWPETAAASLALGWLAVGAGAWAEGALMVASGGSRFAPLLAPPIALLVLLGAVRWLTLPGAMVPRHAVEQPSPGPLRGLVAAVLAAWLVHALFTRVFVAALAWVALGILLERALARARRAPAGRALFLCALATLGHPGQELQGELAVAAALALGAAFLIPWVRRADRRAGVLSALFFGSVLLCGWDPLALAGPLVLVLASHRPQRRFALLAAGGATLACALPGFWLQRPRGRLLFADELVAHALERDVWGLAWPALLVTLLLGALAFPWRARPWTPGTIEEPRREALALAALLALVALALAAPSSRWGEEEALVVFFPLAALLGGLLLIPTAAE